LKLVIFVISFKAFISLIWGIIYDSNLGFCTAIQNSYYEDLAWYLLKIHRGIKLYDPKLFEIETVRQ